MKSKKNRFTGHLAAEPSICLLNNIFVPQGHEQGYIFLCVLSARSLYIEHIYIYIFVLLQSRPVEILCLWLLKLLIQETVIYCTDDSFPDSIFLFPHPSTLRRMLKLLACCRNVQRLNACLTNYFISRQPLYISIYIPTCRGFAGRPTNRSSAAPAFTCCCDAIDLQKQPNKQTNYLLTEWLPQSTCQRRHGLNGRMHPPTLSNSGGK